MLKKAQTKPAFVQIKRDVILPLHVSASPSQAPEEELPIAVMVQQSALREQQLSQLEPDEAPPQREQRPPQMDMETSFRPMYQRIKQSSRVKESISEGTPLPKPKAPVERSPVKTPIQAQQSGDLSKHALESSFPAPQWAFRRIQPLPAAPTPPIAPTRPAAPKPKRQESENPIFTRQLEKMDALLEKLSALELKKPVEAPPPPQIPATVVYTQLLQSAGEKAPNAVDQSITTLNLKQQQLLQQNAALASEVQELKKALNEMKKAEQPVQTFAIESAQLELLHAQQAAFQQLYNQQQEQLVRAIKINSSPKAVQKQRKSPQVPKSQPEAPQFDRSEILIEDPYKPQPKAPRAAAAHTAASTQRKAPVQQKAPPAAPQVRQPQKKIEAFEPFAFDPELEALNEEQAALAQKILKLL